MNLKFSFSGKHVKVTLTECLELPEWQKPLVGLSVSKAAFDRLPQIESLVRQFLDGFVADRDASHESCQRPDALKNH